ncbi:MAG: aspartate/glutamate racemase family protein [Rikenellaceae bacterium]|nr:aspartate/glutamate racemase family protein [Rikenellaceae bacterium]
MIRIVAVHTAMALVEPLNKLFKEHLPEVKLNHIADDSLIPEVIANNCVTPAVRRRLISYYNAAADSGADVVFNCCSSVGKVAEMGDEIAPIKVFRIDGPMAETAVREGKKIGVIATLPTTLGPTVALLEDKAREAGREIEIVEGLAKGAFGADKATHDGLIEQEAMRLADEVDVIVLAQGSMAAMEEKLAAMTGKIVLSSPLLGILGLKAYLKEKGLL